MAARNAERIARAEERGTTPHFLRDNQYLLQGAGGGGGKGNPPTLHGTPDEELFSTYRDFRDEGGGVMEISTLFTEEEKAKPDFHKIRKAGEELARIAGNNVKMTPRIHYKDPLYKQIYGSLIGTTKYERKCPDLMVNGQPYEFEGYVPPFKKRKVGNMLNKGLKQAPNLIIDNTKGANDRYIKRMIFAKSKQTEVNEVWLYEKGKIRQIK